LFRCHDKSSSSSSSLLFPPEPEHAKKKKRKEMQKRKGKGETMYHQEGAKGRLVACWSRKGGFSFNALAIGYAFGSNRANILFGTVKGKIRVFTNDKVWGKGAERDPRLLLLLLLMMMMMMMMMMSVGWVVLASFPHPQIFPQ